MKLKKLTALILSLSAVTIFTSAILSQNGKAGKTGSPGEGTCIDCHSDYSINTGGGSISISGISGSSYTPGTTYNLSITVSRTGSAVFGFGCEALTSSNSNAGTLIVTNSAQTSIKNATVNSVSRQNIVHVMDGGFTSNTHTFNFNWTAPAAGTGNVTLYFAGIAGDHDGSEAGDYVYNSSLALTEGVGCTAPLQPGAIAGAASVCNGSVQTYSVAAVAGATDYIWTLPGGWTGSSITNSINATSGSSGGTISVIAHNACGNSPAQTLVVNTTANVTPAVTIASSAGTSICAGTNVTFTATPTNGGTTPSYQWKLNGSNVGSNSPTYTNAALANGNVVSCVMTTSVTCASSAAATSNTITMTVNPTVTPSLSIASSKGNTICSGSSITFTATPSNGGTTPTYQWKINGATVGTNSPTYTTTSLVNNDVVSCVMTSNASCTSSATATSNSLTITVLNTVVPSVSILSSTGSTICIGTSVTFTATPTNGGATPVYQWKLNGANVGTNSPTYTNASLVNADVVSCVMTSNAQCATSTTVSSNSITMTISSGLIPGVNITASTGNTICAGTNVVFTATPTNGGSAPSYQWKLNGSNVGTNSASYASSSLLNNDVVSCIMTSNATCVTTPTASSNAITIIVSTSLTPAINIVASTGNSICSGTSVTFTATPTNGGSSPVYQWKLNGTNVGTNSSTYTNSTLTNGDIITCTLTSNASCVTNPIASSNTITMNVTAALVPSLNITAAPGNTICTGTNVTFTATPINGGSAPTYQWKLNGANVGSNSPNYSNSALANGNTISCTMTSNAACTSTANATSNTITMAVSSGFTPSVTISSSTGNTICTGSNVVFTASPTNGGTTPTYQWKLNGTNVGANSSTYSIASLVNGDVVNCTMTSNATCLTTSTAISNSITMIVNSSITATITPNGPLSFCQGNSVVLTASAGSSYKWNPGGQTTQSITVTTSGNYNVIVSSGSCSGTSSDITVNVHPLPVVTLASFANVCSNAPAYNLTGGTPNGGVYSGIGVTGGSFDPAVAGIGTSTITYTYTSTAGCSNSATASVVVDNCSSGGCTSAPFTPRRKSGPSSVICGQSGVVYSVRPDTNATTYNWVVPANVNIIANNGNSITVDFLPGFSGGSICVSASNSCGTSPSRCYYIFKGRMRVAPIFGNGRICPTQLTSVYTVNPVAGATSYSWSVNAGAVITSSVNNIANIDFSAVTSPWILVHVHVTNACGQFADEYKWVYMSRECNGGGGGGDGHDHKVLQAGLNNSEFGIYPNPSDGNFTLQVNANRPDIASISIIDILGKVQYSTLQTINEGENAIVLNVGAITNGIYFVKIEIPEEEINIQRLVINK